jgi:hypothetical protein
MKNISTGQGGRGLIPLHGEITETQPTWLLSGLCHLPLHDLECIHVIL